ncbi:MAG TPA: YbhB/YbcL family Raf kinase inhibitor-like protein [Chloroflexota bacterium]|nr:YbhB/YbcL family Raf kinase inhibitor-like protein [Chloroflexota bacterium]
MSFRLTSSAFAADELIPKRFTCDGADQSPPLAWSDPPAGTRSLALIVEDPDAPGGTFIHWVIYYLSFDKNELPAGVPKQAELPDGARQGRNSFRRVGYGGPCPPPGTPHHYHFRLFALDAPSALTPGASASELRSAMNGHVVGEAELIGLYGR